MLFISGNVPLPDQDNITICVIKANLSLCAESKYNELLVDWQTRMCKFVHISLLFLFHRDVICFTLNESESEVKRPYKELVINSDHDTQ